ncbi:MAG: archease [Candidatus Micrarchaeaceae archaeon]
MKGYRFMEHTADVEYVATGRDVEACFSNALMAMFETISYTDRVAMSRSKRIVFKVKDAASNYGDLLWYTLQDSLSEADSKGLFAYKAASIKITGSEGAYKIAASICSRRKSDETAKLDVKGVSRYNLSVKRSKGSIEARVVLDV